MSEEVVEIEGSLRVPPQVDVEGRRVFDDDKVEGEARTVVGSSPLKMMSLRFAVGH